MEYTYVNGTDIRKEAKLIDEAMVKAKAQKEDIVFVYTNQARPLYAYIDALDKEGKLSDENQFRLKICYEKKNLDLVYRSREIPGYKDVKVTSMSQLIGLMDKRACSIIVNDNKRSTLAEIVQQFIYIGYPLTKAEIMLKKDTKDHERAERFMAQVDVLDKNLKAAIEELKKIECTDNRENIQAILNSVKDSCGKIQAQMDKARSRQLKIAVAASKKTGKSVIVNGMIGEELAPTSLELATPNSCIYKKSDNGNYYLNYKEKKKLYLLASELHEDIGAEFEKAQEETVNKFTLPDMEIGYVSNKNNFETYTIYDTPGPDAAGTGHGERAMEAMEQCDVAIFALDYTKYLTDSEEQYLSKVKEWFNTKQKFDSLIFTINKVDARYQDAKGSKSIIKSIDFIRGRLKKIDTCYNDCAIFATSALQYFDAIEAERECGDALQESKDLFVDLRSLARKYEKVRNQLNFLDGRVADMEICSGLSKITLEDLKQYSGMPDLLEYTSYIAKAKARDELVNSVAYEIDLQQDHIRAVVGRIENIKKLMGENSDRIDEITGIFKTFEQNAEKILQEEITEEDIDRVKPEPPDNCALETYWKNLKLKVGNKITFDDIKKVEISGIKESFDDYYDMTKGDNIVNIFYGQMEQVCWNYIQKIQKDKTIVHDTTEWLTDSAIKEVAENIRNSILRRIHNKNSGGLLEKLNAECEQILRNRSDQLDACIRNCKKELEKMDYNYSMPCVPKFDFATSENQRKVLFLKDMRSIVGKMTMEKPLKNLYKKPNIFKRFCDNVFNGSWNKEKYQADYSIRKQEFSDIFCTVQDEMREIVGECGLIDAVVEDEKQMKIEVEQRLDEINKYFCGTLGKLTDNIKIFTSSVDDREKYKEDIEMLEREEELISQINKATNDFMNLWEKISSDMTDLSK